jgi:hypothetical protein
LRSDRGGSLVERLHPADDDDFVLKPKRSGFFPRPWIRCWRTFRSSP